MNRTEMSSFSRTRAIAERKYNGFVLGQLIMRRLDKLPIPAEFGLPQDIIAERITPGEIMDAIETVKQGQEALSVLAEEIQHLHQWVSASR